MIGFQGLYNGYLRATQRVGVQDDTVVSDRFNQLVISEV